MGKINTAANISSAFSNRAAARSGADTSASVGKLASSDRHRELRERGLITHRSTPADIQAVEAHLAAEMRGRMVMQGARYYRRGQYTLPVSSGLLLGLVGLNFAAGSGNARAHIFGAVLLVAAAAVLIGGVAWIIKTNRQREAVAAQADWLDDGTCGWCGTTEAHIVEGEEEHPRVAHAYELEQEVGPLYVEVDA